MTGGGGGLAKGKDLVENWIREKCFLEKEEEEKSEFSIRKCWKICRLHFYIIAVFLFPLCLIKTTRPRPKEMIVCSLRPAPWLLLLLPIVSFDEIVHILGFGFFERSFRKMSRWIMNLQRPRHTQGSQKVIRPPLLPEWWWQRRCCGRPSFSGREWIRRPGRVTAICRSSSTLPPFAAMTGRGVVTDVDPLPPNYAIEAAAAIAAAATAGGDSGMPETSGGAGIRPCRSRQLHLRHFSRELIHRRWVGSIRQAWNRNRTIISQKGKRSGKKPQKYSRWGVVVVGKSRSYYKTD